MSFARTSTLQYAQLALTTLLLILGAWLGFKFYGAIGCFAGIVVGLILGNLVNRLTLDLFVSTLLSDLKNESEDELRRLARDESWGDIRILAIKELITLGGTVDFELPVLYRLAESDCLISREITWSALRELYSDKVEWIEDFDAILSSPEECRNRVELLKAAVNRD